MSSISIQAPVTFGVPARGVSPRAAVAPATVRRTRLRLTARGRRVLLALAAAPVAAGIALSVLFGGSALASGEQTASVAFETVTVLPGDTLWSIAAEVAPAADPRDVVDEIIRLNNLPGGMVQAGSEIAIPTRYTD